MVIFWALAAILALAVTAITAAPLLRTGKRRATAPDDQSAARAAIARDQEFGLMDDDSAAESAAGIDRTCAAENSASGSFRLGRIAAAAALGLSPLAAVFIYLEVGAPGLVAVAGRPGAPSTLAENNAAAGSAAAISAMSDEERRAMIASMVDGLAARLVQSPEDPDGWRMLARSYLVLGRADESAAAWREALKRSDGSLGDWRQYAESLMAGGPDPDGSVSQELEDALAKVREFDADDPLALFILGQAAMKRGDKETALALWTRLRELIPPDAPIAGTLDKMIAQAK